ncbi:MAG: DUF2304 domain-containing protein [Proteobacteria bacterium]|nr:DUF2304 domain-containing protein [Pseudomonadota bacterium]
MTTITILIIGTLLSITILFMVRKDKLHGPYATWWLTVAFSAIILSIFPKGLDKVAAYLEINYPPTLVLVLAISFILLKMLSVDVTLTKQEIKLRRLTQKTAILEEKLKNKK